MQDFTLTVTAQEGDLVMGALAQLPYGQVSALIAKLQGQAQAQMQQQSEAVEAVESVGGTD